MTNYRMVARHVRYWRGVAHKWSTVYPFTGTLASGNYAAAIAALKTLEMGVNYCGTGTIAGGVYEIALYDQSSGGVPVAVTTYFPAATPGSWVAYTSAGYASHAYPVISVAEAALQVEWLAGLSSSGKPVSFKKWFHAVPEIGASPGSPDVLAGDVTTLQTLINTQMAVIGGLGILLGSGSRLAATTCTVRNQFGNHQMPRGRRRKALVSGSGKVSFPSSLLVVPGSDGSLS